MVVIGLIVGYTTLFAKEKPKVAQQQQVGKAWKSGKDAKQKGAFKDSQSILEVNLAYDAANEQPLTIASTFKKVGYIPKKSPQSHKDEAEYSLSLVDAQGKTLNSIAFVPPTEVDGPPPENENDTRPGSVTLEKFTFTENLPLHKDATEVRLVNELGKVLASVDVRNVTSVTPPPPAFSSISGAEYLVPGSTGGTATQSSSTTLDIAFIGDDYTAADMAKFHDDVDRMVAQILAVEPFKSRASQIMLHYVDNTDDLKCAYQGRLIICDRALTASLLNTAGVPYDKALIILNNAAYGGAGDDPIAATYSGTFGPLVGLHELGGHSIGNLSDEYQLSMTEFQMVNCSTTATMPASWVGLVAPADYTKGCNFPNYYRSSANSLMNIITDTYFNVISQRALNQRLDFYAAPFTNGVAPTSEITSPTSSSTVSGLIPVTTTLADDQGVARAELRVDGVLYKTEYLQPFTFQFPSMKFANGNHTLQVTAYDVAGNAGTSTQVIVTTNNPTDTTKPVVVLTGPTSSTTTPKVGGWFYFNASSTDNSGFVDKLELYKDNVLIDTTSVVPYRLKWDTSPETLKGYKFYVKSYDYSGNTGTSTQITVTLVTPPDTTAPTVNITSPANGAVIPSSGNTTIAGSATDNVKVTKIVLMRDTTTLKTCTNVNTCSISVKNSTFTTGAHTITAKAYDAANNVATKVINVTK